MGSDVRRSTDELLSCGRIVVSTDSVCMWREEIVGETGSYVRRGTPFLILGSHRSFYQVLRLDAGISGVIYSSLDCFDPLGAS